MIIDEAGMKPRNNNLILVRLLFAIFVIVTHACWRTTGLSNVDGLSSFLGAPLSVFAVDGFFFLSGFLVYRSLLRRGDGLDFLLARLARIWPALAVSVLATVAIGFAITRAPGAAYFGRETIAFLTGNLSLTFGSYFLTGVTCDGAPCNVNGSLWTLTWEARCYLLLALLWMAGLAGRRAMVRLILPATLAFALAWDIPAVRQFVAGAAGNGVAYQLDLADRLWPLFALGVAASLFRDRIRLSWWVLAGLFAASIVAHRIGIGLHVRAIFVGYAVLCGGFLTARRGAVSGGWPDYSYGMYIYAFPIMMALSALWTFPHYLALAAANVAATLPVAALSWHFVERPVLDRLARRRRETRRADAEGLTPTTGR